MRWVVLSVLALVIVAAALLGATALTRRISAVRTGTETSGTRARSGTFRVVAGASVVAIAFSVLAVLVPSSAYAVSITSVSPSTSSAGAPATYTVDFTTPATLVSGNTITLTGPTFASSSAYTVNGAPEVGVATGTTVLITLGASVSSPVEIIAPGATNPTVAGSQTFTVNAQGDGMSGVADYTITAAVATQLIATAGSGQTADVGTSFATPLTVEAEDQFGNAVTTGVPVTFTAPGATGPSGTFATTPLITTGINGVAAAPAFKANGITGGPYLVTAAATGLTPATFNLTNALGAAARLAAPVGNGQSARVGTPFPLPFSVTAENALGQPVPNASVTFSTPSSGPSGTFAGTTTVSTDASGVATSPVLTANGVAGVFTVTAGAGGGSTSFSATNFATPGVPTILTATAEDASARVRWLPPASDGFNSISGYLIACSNGATLSVGVTTAAIFPGLVNGDSYSFAVAAVNAAGGGPLSAVSNTVVPRDVGYWLVASDGGIFSYGTHLFDGSTGAVHLNRPIVGMASTPNGTGYWLVASDGGIFAFGSALFYGSTGAMHLDKPIVAMAATPDGKGYWLVAADGGIFAFGDARFHGSMGGKPLNRPIVGMATTALGSGYWLVASDGGIFAFGSAHYYGSTGAMHLNRSIVGMAPDLASHGYWLVASDGGIFAFGDASFYGSTGGRVLNSPIVGMSTTPAGRGYWLVASDGGIFTFGDAAFSGSTGGMRLNQPIVALGR